MQAGRVRSGSEPRRPRSGATHMAVMLSETYETFKEAGASEARAGRRRGNRCFRNQVDSRRDEAQPGSERDRGADRGHDHPRDPLLHELSLDTRPASCALLAAFVLCPLMANAAAAPAVSSCHDRPSQDHHGDTSAAFTCCATVVVTALVHTSDESDAAPPAAVERRPHRAQDAAWRADRPRPRSAPPPLFLRHASLLI